LAPRSCIKKDLIGFEESMSLSVPTSSLMNSNQRPEASTAAGSDVDWKIKYGFRRHSRGAISSKLEIL
jgi:hypothetical protein